MPRLTKEERAARKAEAARHAEKMTAIRAEARRVVATGKCPQCERKLRRNMSMTGWWQCSQFGSEMFRAEPTNPPCSFQCFTE